MRELLSDNITLLSQLESVHAYPVAPALPGHLSPRLREITSLPSWIYCFLAYVAICTTDFRTRDQLAYARLLVRESLIHSGQGWLEYDRVFRQQRALDLSIPWSTLHAGIQAATILGHSQGPASFCSLCWEADHTIRQCALSYIYPARSPQSSYSAPNQSIRHLLKIQYAALGIGVAVCSQGRARIGTFAACVLVIMRPRIAPKLLSQVTRMEVATNWAMNHS